MNVLPKCIHFEHNLDFLSYELILKKRFCIGKRDDVTVGHFWSTGLPLNCNGKVEKRAPLFCLKWTCCLTSFWEPDLELSSCSCHNPMSGAASRQYLDTQLLFVHEGHSHTAWRSNYCPLNVSAVPPLDDVSSPNRRILLNKMYYSLWQAK